jgi:hypothetical protein
MFEVGEARQNKAKQSNSTATAQQQHSNSTATAKQQQSILIQWPTHLFRTTPTEQSPSQQPCHLVHLSDGHIKRKFGYRWAYRSAAAAGCACA